MDGVLTANLTVAKTGSYRCRGILDPLIDMTVKADLEIANANTCAAVWFRYQDAPPSGYALQICHDRMQLITHTGNRVTVMRGFYYDLGHLLEPGVSTQVAVRTDGATITIFRDGVQVGSLTDATFTQGRVVLGVFSPRAGSPPPYQAIFHRVQIFRAG